MHRRAMSARTSAAPHRQDFRKPCSRQTRRCAKPPSPPTLWGEIGMFREFAEEDLGASDYSSDRAASLRPQPATPSSRSGIPSREDMAHQFLDWLRSKPADAEYNYA